ncbi:MAG: Eco57I restriction-modification methylase domain-containing protein [Candidatus Omnitrophota bacterium]|nr:Eco57I restriction-modification methylase domain-containing protein [Candidatus Omnitrophota bacterium]
MKALQEIESSRVDLLRQDRERGVGSLLDYAESLAAEHAQTADLEQRKARGQFFTPKEVARFMASLIHVKGKRMSVLDPGAGIGILTAAFCERLLNLREKVQLRITAYENDTALLPHLRRVLRKCEAALQERGHDVTLDVLEDDFIVKNATFFKRETPFLWEDERPAFDYIISNPPYYKLTAASRHGRMMRELGLGQPNAYAFFMALSLPLLKPDGEMVFITPRSFCSGLYYKKFRSWLLEHAAFSRIHVFGSRSEVFEHDGVLQENVILRTTPKNEKRKVAPVKITISENHSFKDLKTHIVPAEDMVHRMNGDALIKIPTSRIHLLIQHAIKDWRYTLHDFGLEVSTGPIVDFRAKDFLTDFVDERTTSPLIWMHNIQDMKVIWPAKKNGKQTAVLLKEASKPLLLPVRNYVLIKRFSSKEQKRRLYAGALLENDFKFKVIGIENHVNYLYRKQGRMAVEEVMGIAALLNSSMVDEYFRCLNGNTQVNASDLRALPLPSLEVIRQVGRRVNAEQPRIGLSLDTVVANALGISNRIVRELHEEDGRD